MGTVPVPYSPIAGDDATQAHVLTWADAAAYLLGSATSGGSKRPLSVMRQTVAQSITPSGTDVAVTFDTEDVDYDNGHSTSTNTSRYTAATAGWHWVSYCAGLASNATGFRIAYLRTNGVNPVPGSACIVPAVSGSQTNLEGGRLLFLNAGDYVELMVNQNTGGALLTSVFAYSQSSLSVEWRSN